jgi:hypothetical protein
MITTHSQFETILDPSHDQANDFKFHPARSVLIDLLTTFLNPHSNPNETEHLIRLSKAYTGSIHESDRKILSLFQMVESKYMISVTNYLMDHFGKTTGGEGLGRPNQRFNTSRMSQSLYWYNDNLENTEFPYNSKIETGYDPNFILPLLIHSILQGRMTEANTNQERSMFMNTFDAHEAIENNQVGMIIMALSSKDPSIRNTAYFALDLIYDLLKHFDPEKLREKTQLLLLLDNLRNNITDRDEPQRVPTPITLFLAQSIHILTKPEHLLYPTVNACLLQRPIMDLDDIPMFYNLFNSTSDDGRKERTWIMRLLAASVRDQMVPYLIRYC